MANAIVDHLIVTGQAPTVRRYIAFNWMGMYRTVRQLEKAGLVEEVSALSWLVLSGELIDAHGEFPQESKERFDEMVGE
jgi:hypothetical protein